jgi:hypothetical protein
MDRWLTALAPTGGPGRTGSRMLRNRPADLGDGCWTPAGERVVEFATWQGAGTCNTLYPSFGDTRIAAGAPLRENVLKCQLKPLTSAARRSPRSSGPAARRVPRRRLRLLEARRRLPPRGGSVADLRDGRLLSLRDSRRDQTSSLREPAATLRPLRFSS